MGRTLHEILSKRKRAGLQDVGEKRNGKGEITESPLPFSINPDPLITNKFN